MKHLQNPTTFFFHQAQNTPSEHNIQIQRFVSLLINQSQCSLCLESYNLIKNIPRIMIHCGHTFCTPCLEKFYMNRRVRCPMCLKLVKNIDSIERLPINHSIYTILIQKDNQRMNQEIKLDARQILYSEFQRVQKQAHMNQNPQKIDPESGLPFCVFHDDRVQHFYCESHKNTGCRVCIQVGHSKPDCSVIDLYIVEDPQKYFNQKKQDKLQQSLDRHQRILNIQNDGQNLVDYQDTDSDNEAQSSSNSMRKSI